MPHSPIPEVGGRTESGGHGLLCAFAELNEYGKSALIQRGFETWQPL